MEKPRLKRLSICSQISQLKSYKYECHNFSSYKQKTNQRSKEIKDKMKREEEKKHIWADAGQGIHILCVSCLNKVDNHCPTPISERPPCLMSQVSL